MACLTSAGLIVGLGERLTFFNDDWFLLLQRPGIESHGGLDLLLAPHNANMVVVLVAVTKVLVALFGLHSQLPFRLVLAATVCALGVVVYRAVGERMGAPLGLLAAALVLFLGPAWEVLLFYTALNHAGAVALGVGALLLLQRATSGRDAAACGLLVCAVALSPTGLASVGGAAVVVIVRRRLRDVWIPAVPAAVFGLWWAGYGRRDPSGVTGGHIAHLPHYIFDGLSSGLASVTGLNHQWLPSVIASGHLLAVLALVGLAVWVARGGRPRPYAYVFAATLLTFWLLGGASAIAGRGAIASRYQIVDASLLLVLAAELLRNVRLSRAATAIVLVCGAAAVISNLFILHGGYAFMREHALMAEADTGALRIAGARAPAQLELVEAVAEDPYLLGVTAGRYRTVTAAHGRPAYLSPAQLERAPVTERQAADSVLLAAYDLSLRPAPPPPGSAACRELTVGPGQRATTTAAGTVWLRNGGARELVVGLDRFAPPIRPHYVGFLKSGTSAQLAFPADEAAAPWRLTAWNPAAAGTGRVAVCR